MDANLEPLMDANRPEYGYQPQIYADGGIGAQA
jgi:hypothetical protein